MSPATPAVLAVAESNLSRIPSGSHAHALDSSRGRNTGSPEQAACAATWLIARSSRVILSAARRRVAHPAHHAHVVLAQPVAQGGLRGAHIDPLARQQVADPGGPCGAAVPQPVLPFARVGRDHLLGGLVDVPGHDPGHAQRGGGDHLGVICLPGQFLEQPVGEARVPDPVGAQQRGQRRAALRQPARVLHGRGRGLHVGQVDLVLHDLQARVDVAVERSNRAGPAPACRRAAAGSPGVSPRRHPRTPRRPGGPPPPRRWPPARRPRTDPCPPADSYTFRRACAEAADSARAWPPPDPGDSPVPAEPCLIPGS